MVIYGNQYMSGLLLLVCCWLAATATGSLLLQVCCWFSAAAALLLLVGYCCCWRLAAVGLLLVGCCRCCCCCCWLIAAGAAACCFAVAGALLAACCCLSAAAAPTYSFAACHCLARPIIIARFFHCRLDIGNMISSLVAGLFGETRRAMRKQVSQGRCRDLVVAWCPSI